jgi:hypothetical protein
MMLEVELGKMSIKVDNGGGDCFVGGPTDDDVSVDTLRTDRPAENKATSCWIFWARG